MSKLFLIDGTYELFRAFYGAPHRLAPDGKEVGAAVGLLRSLSLLLRDPEVSHVACAFDHVIESFRNDLFSGYKTGEGIDPKLLGQFDLAEQAAQALGITVWPMIEYEADDALATAAARWAHSPTLEQVLLCSPDKDLAQCVEGSRVVCLNRRTGEVMDEAGVQRKFGVRPASIPDWLALVGDSADGVPGVPGWGKSSASMVLSVYPHLDDIPVDPNRWTVRPRGAERLAGALAAHREQSRLYLTLTTLRRDVPLPEDLQDLEWNGLPGLRYSEFCRKVGIDPEEDKFPSR